MAERLKPTLQLDSDDDMMVDDEKTFDVEASVFLKDGVAVHSTGIIMKDSPKKFTVVPKELEFGEIVGRGSSSHVQRGIHKPTRTKLALKVINVFDKDKRQQLIREIQTLYDASCPCLIEFYGAFYREGAITIALEYMDGGALTNLRKQLKRRIPEKVLANMAYQILWGLAYLKKQKRVHRDIKPSNLLINSQGRIKLTDFGISAALQNSIAMCGTFVGTFKYMSPERIMSKLYSYPGDIWSFGIVMLECALNQYPYSVGKTHIEMVQTILESGPPAPPKGAKEGVAGLISRQPEHRLPADILLGSPWLEKHGATGLEAAIANVAEWIREITSSSATSSPKK